MTGDEIQETSPLASVRQALGWTSPPPETACPWCGVEPFVACKVNGPARTTREAVRLRHSPAGIHPARRAA